MRSKARLVGIAAAGRLPGSTTSDRLTKHACLPRRRIDHPHLRDAVPGIERHFDAEIVGEARVSHFDNEQRIGRARMPRRVEVGPGLEDRDVGLGLAEVVEPERILAADEDRCLCTPTKVPGEQIDDRGVQGANRRISPSISSTRSAGPRMPVSPIR